MGKKLVLFLALILAIWALGTLVMGRHNQGYSTPVHKNAGKFEPWQCTFERDHVPRINPAADRLFQEARSLQKTLYNPTEADKVRIFNLYKQASDLGHWKAMFNLANCYMKGEGVKSSVTSADAIYDAMMVKGIPAGFYGKSILTRQGRGVMQDDKEADRLLHEAADLGSTSAQYSLGEYYIYKEQRDKQGLAYHICALAQGHAQSAKAIGFYLYLIEKNYPMAMEYYWRATSLGDYESAMRVEAIFSDANPGAGPQVNYGYNQHVELSKKFGKYYDQIKADPATRFPNIFKDNSIPDNPLISNEQSRKMPSKLKELYGGKWPDEIFPELAPGYMPPKE